MPAEADKPADEIAPKKGGAPTKDDGPWMVQVLLCCLCLPYWDLRASSNGLLAVEEFWSLTSNEKKHAYNHCEEPGVATHLDV